MAEPRPLNDSVYDPQKKRGSSGSSKKKGSETKPKYSVAPKTKTGLPFVPKQDDGSDDAAPKNETASTKPKRQQTAPKRPGILRDSGGDSGLRLTRSTMDKRFSDSYSQRAAIQPSVGGVARTSNVKVDLKNPHQRRDAKGRVVDGKRRMVDPTSQVVVEENRKADKKEVVDPEVRQEQLAASEAMVTGTGQYREPAQRAPRNFVGRQYNKAKDRAKKKIKTKGKTKKTDRIKASAVNGSMMSWLVPSYFFIQLPFAVLNLIFLAMYYLVTNLTEGQEEKYDEEGNFLGEVVNFFWKGVKMAVEALNSVIEFFTGLDLLGWVGAIPQQGYLLTVAVLLGYAMFTMLTMGLMYMFAGLKPLSGKGSTSKTITFMLCLMGYFAPFFNLFPWAVIWAAAVWKNPK